MSVLALLGEDSIWMAMAVLYLALGFISLMVVFQGRWARRNCQSRNGVAGGKREPTLTFPFAGEGADRAAQTLSCRESASPAVQGRGWDGGEAAERSMAAPRFSPVAGEPGDLPRPSQLQQQVFSWWRIFPAVSLALVFYPHSALLLILPICALALRELTLHYIRPQGWFVVICLVFFALLLALSFFGRSYLLCLPLLLAAQVLCFYWRRSASQLLFLLFFASAYGVSFLLHYSYLPFAPQTNRAWLFYLLTLTALNDIAQFVFGKCFGKHKIAHAISPNKTWQGLMGGLLVSLVLSLALGSYLQLASTTYLLLLAPLLCLGGFAGDLLFSAAKRFLRIKDFSQLIPGHGGILDRVDSLVVTAPLLYCTLYFTHNGFD